MATVVDEIHGLAASITRMLERDPANPRVDELFKRLQGYRDRSDLPEHCRLQITTVEEQFRNSLKD